MNDIEKQLNKMKIGDSCSCMVAYWDVTRVPGGFIYHCGNTDSQTAVFVPEAFPQVEKELCIPGYEKMETKNDNK